MTNSINVPRELLERLRSYIPNGDGHNSQYANDLADAVVALEGLSAPSPAGVDGEHEAQPEVAENTGSRSMANKLQSQGCTGRTEVDGVAAPDEASDAVDIYAWSTFDGEGGYDLRMYENNETYQAEWLALNGEKYSGWVKPLCRLSDAQAIIDGLREERDSHQRACIRAMEDRNQLAKCLKFARTTMSVIADNANLRGVEHRSLIAEVNRIDAALAELPK